MVDREDDPFLTEVGIDPLLGTIWTAVGDLDFVPTVVVAKQEPPRRLVFRPSGSDTCEHVLDRGLGLVFDHHDALASLNIREWRHAASRSARDGPSRHGISTARERQSDYTGTARMVPACSSTGLVRGRAKVASNIRTALRPRIGPDGERAPVDFGRTRRPAVK